MEKKNAINILVHIVLESNVTNINIASSSFLFNSIFLFHLFFFNSVTDFLALLTADDDKFECTDCGKQFTARCNLIRHKRCNCPLGRSLPRYKCNMCGYSTGRSDSWRTHLEKHKKLIQIKIK